MKNSHGVLGYATISPIERRSTHIEIVGSTNPRLNAMARDSRITIKAALGKQYAKIGITIVNDFADLQKLVAKKPDLVILGMKLVLLKPEMGYDASPKVWLSDYLRDHGIAFTGSDTAALTMEFDKDVAKQKVIDAGLKSSRYFVSRITAPSDSHDLNFPLFVKPSNRGDSKGVDDKSVVHSDAELYAKIHSIHADCSSDAIIEEYLPGREFSVAVIRQPHTDSLLAMPIEITIPVNKHGDSFLSESIKSADTEQVIAVDDIRLRESLNALAIGVFNALGSRDYGRIDMRLDAFGVPSFIEANLMPGLSDHGYLSRCFTLNGHVSYNDMITSIAKLGFERVALPQNLQVVAL